MPPSILSGVGAAASAVALGGIIVVVAGASATRQPIQDQASGANTGGVHKREGAADGVARSFSGPHYHAGGLSMRYHEQGIAHGQDRRAINYDTVKFSNSGGNQFLEAIAA